MGLRISLLAAPLLLVPTGAAAAARDNWAAAQIRAVTGRGLMGTHDPATFRPNAVLTAQALANLAFDLEQTLLPPPEPPAPTDPTPPLDPTAPVDPTAPLDPAAPTDPTSTPAPSPVGASGDPGQTTPTDPTATTPAPTDPTATAPAPVPPAPPAPAPATPPKVAHPAAAATMAQLDARLVASLGLSGAAAEFAKGARAAGLKVPGRFGTEVVARLLGLRLNHPATEDSLELLPNDPATRAEAAYSAAQILGFGFGSWQIAGVQSLADSFALPALSPWQTRVLDVAVSKIGMPYIWGGTSDGPEAPFGVRSRGGYDCSGFVWRVYKLQSYPDERSLASVLRGRTTYVMSAEVPASERLGIDQLQPGDVIFFGDRGPRSQPAQVGHMGIYLGNEWFIHSSGEGVALETLNGWYRQKFAWARRPLREAGL